MEPSRHTHHYGVWIATGVVVLLVGTYGAGLIVLDRAKGTIATQATELAAEVRREESVHILSDLLEDLSEETTKLNAFFVPPEGAVGAIERVEALSSSVGVPVSASDVHIQDRDPLTGEGTLFLNVATEGSWRSVTRVLMLLDTLPFQSRLQSVVLSLINGDDESPARWSFKGLLAVPLRQ